MEKRSSSKIALDLPNDLAISTDLRIIGHARTPYQQRFGVPRQSGLAPDAIATIELLPEYQPELSFLGLERCSHLWVIYLFHQNPSRKFLSKVTPPRLSGEKLGVFATRSPNRPNPIGLSLVEIKSVVGSQLTVGGIDFLDGTPILDLKPYMAQIESIPHARDWTGDSPMKPQACEWSETALSTLADMSGRDPYPAFRKLVEQTLALDPRPFSYKTVEKYKKEFVTRLANVDIRFRFQHPSTILIVDIIP